MPVASEHVGAVKQESSPPAHADAEKTEVERAPALGNQQLAGLLSAAPPPELGRTGDIAESRADLLADRAMRAMHGAGDHVDLRTPMDRGGVGGALSASDRETIASTRGGGHPLDAGLSAKLGAVMGGGEVRVHTDAAADRLARSTDAAALTLGRDVWFRAGQYDPSSVAGQRLIAHEVAHTRAPDAEQTVRRTWWDDRLRKWYSDALAGQAITEDNGVITATSGSGFDGGHTTLFMEGLMGGTGYTHRLDLFVGGGASSGSGASAAGSGMASGAKSGGDSREAAAVPASSQAYSSGSTGSQSGSHGGLVIKLGTKHEENRTKLKKMPRRRSWVVTKVQMGLALTKAKQVQREIADYTYRLTGRGVFTRKKTINCARFGAKVLKAAGIDASAGMAVLMPSTLATGADVGHEVDADYAADLAARRAAEQAAADARRQAREAEAAAAAAAAGAHAAHVAGVAAAYAGLGTVKLNSVDFSPGKVVTASKSHSAAPNVQMRFVIPTATETFMEDEHESSRPVLGDNEIVSPVGQVQVFPAFKANHVARLGCVARLAGEAHATTRYLFVTLDEVIAPDGSAILT